MALACRRFVRLSAREEGKEMDRLDSEREHHGKQNQAVVEASVLNVEGVEEAFHCNDET